MPTYLSLVNFTQQGIQNIKESPARLDAARKAFKAMGGELRHFYLTLGRYDIVLIGEHPNDETTARAALALGSMGNVRSETFRAFTEEEYRKLIKSLP